MKFKCFVNSTEMSFCFSGSSCVVDLQGREMCLCDPDSGFVHDFSFFHFQNCSMPTWFPLVMFLTICVDIALAFCQYHITLKHAKPEVELLMHTYMITVAFT